MSALATVLATTLEQSRRKLIMASVKSNALVAWAFATNRVEYETGGYNITNPLVTGRNNNITSYEYYDQLPVNQTNEFVKLEFRWSRVAGTVIISDQEQDENQGPEAVLKLVTAKVDVLEESIQEQFSIYLYGTGGGTDPLGLGTLLPSDPTTGVVGNLDRAQQTQWRPSSYDFASTLDSTNIEEAFDDILLDLTLKGERPDLILVGRNVLRAYRQAVRDKVIISLQDSANGKRMFDLGFDGVTHNRIPMLYDEDCPVNNAFFINSKYMRLHMLKGVNMKVKDLAAPWTMDAVGKRVVWQGQWCIWRAYRTHARLAM